MKLIAEREIKNCGVREKGKCLVIAAGSYLSLFQIDTECIAVNCRMHMFHVANDFSMSDYSLIEQTVGTETYRLWRNYIVDSIIYKKIENCLFHDSYGGCTLSLRIHQILQQNKATLKDFFCSFDNHSYIMASLRKQETQDLILKGLNDHHRTIVEEWIAEDLMPEDVEEDKRLKKSEELIPSKIIPCSDLIIEGLYCNLKRNQECSAELHYEIISETIKEIQAKINIMSLNLNYNDVKMEEVIEIINNPDTDLNNVLRWIQDRFSFGEENFKKLFNEDNEKYEHLLSEFDKLIQEIKNLYKNITKKPNAPRHLDDLLPT